MYRKIEETPARKIFSHLDTYNRYEKGIREIPLDSLMLLAKTYDCSLDYLAGISDQPLFPARCAMIGSKREGTFHV